MSTPSVLPNISKADHKKMLCAFRCHKDNKTVGYFEGINSKGEATYCAWGLVRHVLGHDKQFSYIRARLYKNGGPQHGVECVSLPHVNDSGYPYPVVLEHPTDSTRKIAIPAGPWTFLTMQRVLKTVTDPDPTV